MSCGDGHEYVVKGRQVGRAIVNEQVIAQIGLALGAPVGQPALIDVPAELIAAEPAMQHMLPGVSHGTRYLRDCSDRLWIEHVNVAVNRARFALLAVLYGWGHAGDHQLIYANAAPHLVYSVDHGHFFPTGPDWTAPALDQAPSATLYQDIVSTCGLTSAELRAALAALDGVQESAIIRAVAAPPDEWGCTMDERVTMVAFFAKRRSELLALVPGLT